VQSLVMPQAHSPGLQSCSHHGNTLRFFMRIIAKRTLRQFWETHPRGSEAKTQLQVWHSTVKAADWATPADIKQTFGDASILKNSRVVFNISGNKFRLIVRSTTPTGSSTCDS
jgi:mRNA interferase HigB